MKHHIEVKQGFNIIGFEIQTHKSVAEKEIGQLWHKFVAEKSEDKIPNKASFQIIALYSDYSSKHDDYCEPDIVDGPIDHYSYLIGCEVSSLTTVPAGMVGKEIPEARYAVFTTKGHFPQSLKDAWKAIHSAGLERTYQFDFEDYRAFESDEKIITIYVGIN